MIFIDLFTASSAKKGLRNWWILSSSILGVDLTFSRSARQPLKWLSGFDMHDEENGTRHLAHGAPAQGSIPARKMSSGNWCWFDAIAKKFKSFPVSLVLVQCGSRGLQESCHTITLPCAPPLRHNSAIVVVVQYYLKRHGLSRFYHSSCDKILNFFIKL